MPCRTLKKKGTNKTRKICKPKTKQLKRNHTPYKTGKTLS